MTLPERLAMKSIWDASDVKFFRKDLVEISPDLSADQSIEATERPECTPAPIADRSVRSSEMPPAANQSPAVADTFKRANKKTGPAPTERTRVKERMLADIRSKTRSLPELDSMKQVALAELYGVRSRDTALKALWEAEKEEKERTRIAAVPEGDK